MAFVKTMTGKSSFLGMTLEVGTWALSGGDTAGTLTADVTEQPEIVQILGWGFANDADNDPVANRVTDTTMKITTTANNTGDYWILGRSA